MQSRLIIVLCLLVLLASAGFAAEPVTIGVMEFLGGAEVDQRKADVLADVIATTIDGLGDARVLTRSDLAMLADIEQQQRLMKCTEEECLAEIGGALGIEWMVTGSVGRFGEEYVVNLKLLDAMSSRVAARVSRRLPGNARALLNGLPGVVVELFEKAVDRLTLLPTVEVASRRIQLLAESPSAVTVFTRKDIQCSGATDIPDLLRRVPNFDVYRLKPGYPLVGARALTEQANNLVLLQVDGREDAIELTGFAFWDALTFDLEEVERIEVIRGPGSALYGANAFAAVVSVTTVSDRENTGAHLLISGGEIGKSRLFGRYQDASEVGKGVLSYSLGFGRESTLMPSDRRDLALGFFRSHGWIRYRRGNQLDLSLQGGFVSGGGTMYLVFGDMVTRPANHYFVMGKGDFLLADAVRLKAQLYHVMHSGRDHYRASLRANDLWIADFPDFSISTHTIDGQVQLDLRIRENFLVISGTNLRFTRSTVVDAIISRKDEVRGAAFAHLEWRPWEMLQLTGGLRFDLNNHTAPALSPRMVAVLRPWPDHTFRLGYGLAFRKPAVFESQAHGLIKNYNPATPEIVELAASQLGNGALVNELVHSIEAGWRAKLLESHLLFSLDLFYSLYRDTINLVVDIRTSPLGLPDLSRSKLQYENQGDEVNAVGGELELVWTPDADWNLFGNLGLRHVVNQMTGERRSSEPRLRTNLGGRFAPEGGGVLVDLVLHFVSSYDTPLIDPNGIFNPPKTVPLGNELLLIGRLAYRWPFSKDGNLEVGVTLQTPLGNPVREYAGGPMPSQLSIDTAADFGGEINPRLVMLYLRTSH